MKLTLLLVLVVTFALIYESDAGWFRIRIRGRRIWRRVKPYLIRAGIAYALGKRDIADFAHLDKNLDGLLDQAELEKIMSTREASEILETVDDDEKSAITMEQFEELFRHLRETEEEIEESIQP